MHTQNGLSKQVALIYDSPALSHTLAETVGPQKWCQRVMKYVYLPPNFQQYQIILLDSSPPAQQSYLSSHF